MGLKVERTSSVLTHEEADTPMVHRQTTHPPCQCFLTRVRSKVSVEAGLLCVTPPDSQSRDCICILAQTRIHLKGAFLYRNIHVGYRTRPRPIEFNATSRALHSSTIEANGVHAVLPVQQSKASTARAFIRADAVAAVILSRVYS